MVLPPPGNIPTFSVHFTHSSTDLIKEELCEFIVAPCFYVPAALLNQQHITTSQHWRKAYLCRRNAAHNLAAMCAHYLGECAEDTRDFIETTILGKGRWTTEWNTMSHCNPAFGCHIPINRWWSLTIALQIVYRWQRLCVSLSLLRWNTLRWLVML